MRNRTSHVLQNLAITLLVIGCALVMMMWLFQTSGRLKNLVVGRWSGVPVVFSAPDVNGIERGTAVVFKGHRVGSILTVSLIGRNSKDREPAQQGTFEMTAILDEAMIGYRVVARSPMPVLGMLQLTPIELSEDPAGNRLERGGPVVIPVHRETSGAAASTQNLMDASKKLLEALETLTAAVAGTKEGDKRQNLAAILEDARGLVSKLDRLTASLTNPDQAPPSSLVGHLAKTLANLEETSKRLHEIFAALAGPPGSGAPEPGKPGTASYAQMRENLAAASASHAEFARKLQQSQLLEKLSGAIDEVRDSLKEINRLTLILQDRADRMGRSGVGGMFFDNKPKDPVEFQPLLPAEGQKGKRQ